MSTQTENSVEIEKVLGLREQARSIDIDEKNYEMARKMLSEIEDLQKELDAEYKPQIALAHSIHTDLIEQKNLLDSFLNRSKSILKAKIVRHCGKNPSLPKPNWYYTDTFN